MEQTLILRPDTDTVFIILLVCMALYSYLFKQYGRSCIQILRSVNDNNLASRLFRENSRMINRPLAAMVLISTISVGTLLVWSVYILGGLSSFTATYPVFGFLVFGIVLSVRYTLFQILGLVSDKRHFLDRILFSLWTTMATLGPISILFTALSVFGPRVSQVFFSWIGLGLLAMGYSIFLAKGAFASIRETNIAALHLFYYFCALEIMPFLVAYRTLLS